MRRTANPNCEDCLHFRRDTTYPRAIGYGRCAAPKAKEGAVNHFIGVSRARYGACGPNGVLFESAAPPQITV
jgi:hypothetical protein